MTTQGWITQKGMRIFFWVLTSILILTITLCIIFYPERYRFFKQHISSLGQLYSTWSHYPNTISRWIFSIGFIILGIGTFFMMIAYTNVKGFYGAGWKVFTLVIFFFGCILTAFPCDHPDKTFRDWHVIGAVCFVSGFALYNFMAQMLRFVRRHVRTPKEGKRKRDFYFDLIFVILVFVTVAWYLLSGLFHDILHITVGDLDPIFNLYIAQKMILITGCIAAFRLDIDDM
jgi:hypothetical protein